MSSPAVDFRFALPPLPPHHVPRPRLLAALDRAETTALTLVSAAAGAGKTVLLSDWARRQDKPVAWLALTAEDDDPGRFWRLLLEAGRVSGQVYPPSAWASGRTVELLDSVYGRSVARQPRLNVVLDDAHVLTQPQIVEGLDRLVERWSSRVRLLMTARSDPLIRLPRYRLAGQVREIRAADLAMTEDEAAELLGAHGVSLPAADLRVLTTRTEGWSAGLRLAALRMQDNPRPAEFVALLAMDQGSIGEYLTAEVLALQPEHVTRLLVETSFLDEVTGPLADAVTGMRGCASLLVRLARTNSFVIPLDPEQTTFRYHQLFREVLRHLANREPAGRLRSRYARAADWYRRRGDLVSALRWTIRSEDQAAIRTLLVHGGLAEAFVGGQDLDGIGLPALAEEEPAVGATPAGQLELAVARWAIAAVTEQPGTAGAALRRLPPLGPDLRAAEPAVRVSAAVAQLVLGRKAGEQPLLDAAAAALLTDPDLAGPVRQVRGLRASVLLAQARSRLAAGGLAEVEPLLERARDEAEQEDVPAVLVDILSVLAFALISAGRPRHADEAMHRAAGLAAAHPGQPRPVALDLAIARAAEVAADWRAMDAAVDRVLAAGPVYPDTGIAATVAFVQAANLVGRGDLAAARTLLRHNDAIDSYGGGVVAVLRDSELADIDIRLGRPHAALRLIEPHQRGPFGTAVGVTAARAHLALGDLRGAAACITAVLTTPSPFVSRRTAVEAILCDAEIADRRGQESRAAELLDRALLLADGELALPFVRVARTFAPLLARHPVLAGRWPVALSEPAARPHPGSRLLDPLTVREQVVLRLMSTGMSTAEMADELHLSVNTVKSHLAAIYRKLAVGRRREAVSRARELELL